MILRLSRQRGAILIIALWSLGMLTIFALNLASGVRQKINLSSRLEDRSKLHFMAQAGVKKAIALINADLTQNGQGFSPLSKAFRHNNPKKFSEIILEDGQIDVSYEYFRDDAMRFGKRFGVVDEQSKMNINKVDASSLKGLIKETLKFDDIQSNSLANAIIDWREYGEGEIVGFYSDEYYENLDYPYPLKKADFEVLDELLLVKGVNEEMLRKLSNYVTIYGDGKININTASRPVLVALGFTGELADKILFVRRGEDKTEATADDFIFITPNNLYIDLSQFVTLTDEEIRQINEINNLARLTTVSSFYGIRSEARLSHKDSSRMIKCIFNASEHKIEYWREN